MGKMFDKNEGIFCVIKRLLKWKEIPCFWLLLNGVTMHSEDKWCQNVNSGFKWKVQVGVTPEGVEVPRSLVDEEMQEKVNSMPEQFRPALPKGPDCKWRYMWRVGPRPTNTRFKVLCLSLFSYTYMILLLLSVMMPSFVGTKFRACHTWRFS